MTATHAQNARQTGTEAPTSSRGAPSGTRTAERPQNGSAASHRKACVGCRGDQWLTGPEHDGWPTIRPCPDCLPVTAARHRNGDYRTDVPHRAATTIEADQIDSHRPRTALHPWPQMLEHWPAPGPRTTEATA